MKRYTRYIIATFAAIASLVSCAKEPALVPEDSGLLPEGQTREITLSFGSSTKTTLNADGKTPEFCADDVIKVSNATRSEDCTVTGSGSSAKILTHLDGALTAVYPSTAANLTGTGSTPINTSSGARPYKVSSTQSGLFKDANICTAAIPAYGTSATFDNVTPLLKFYVDESIGVKSLTITSTADIASDGGGKTITVDPAGEALISTVTTGNTDPRLCYVAILPDVNANTLTYTSVTTVQGQGTVTKTMTSDVTLAANHIYQAFIPYYIDLGTAGKWAYCNVGAFLPEENGDYFAWGDITGQTAATSGTGVFATAFDWDHAPFNNGSSSYDETYFNTQKGTVCPGGVLAKDYDVANKVLGGTWCMPTTAEFEALLALPTMSWKANYNSSGVNGYLFTDNNGNSIFLPAAGYGDGTGLSSVGVVGRYWSSSLNTDYPNNAYSLSFSDGVAAGMDYNYRYYGRSVRPVKGTLLGLGDLEDGGEY